MSYKNLLRPRRQRPLPTECPNCAGDLVDGACAFCPPELDEDRDHEFAELESHFRPGRTD